MLVLKIKRSVNASDMTEYSSGLGVF